MSSRYALGVDFGGTNVKLGLVSSSGKLLSIARFDSRGSRKPKAFLNKLVCAIMSLTRSAGIDLRRLKGVGMGVPGPVDFENGVVRYLVNVPGWRNVPLRRWLERRLRCECAIDNDANLFTLGEWRFGSGRGSSSLVGLTLGTGVGGGLLLDGLLYRGASGAAGELGHTIIEAGGRRCACGAKGCLEAYVGTKAILDMARLAMRSQSSGLLRKLSRKEGALTPHLLAKAAMQGDIAARDVWVKVGRYLGIGLSSIVNALNPQRIVIGGGVSNAWPLFYPSLIKTVRLHAMDVSLSSVRFVRAQLGDFSAVVGGAVSVGGGSQ